MADDKLTLGAYFKAEREQRGIDLKEIEARTKISAQTLKFMEDDYLDMLPPKTFVRGFLKVIAEEFEMDIEELMLHMDETLPPDGPKEKHVRDKLKTVRALPEGALKWVIAAAAILLLIISLSLCSRGDEELSGKGSFIETTFAA